VARKPDVTVAKNYLHEDEITELNRIVVMFLDFAEDQARRRKRIFLRDRQTRLDDLLRCNKRNALFGLGTVSCEEADRRAHEEYARFEERRRRAAEAAGVAEAMKILEQTAEQVERLKPTTTLKGKAGGKV
jgi:hypothetical protein